MNFEWDKEKNRKNIIKHSVDFGDIIEVFQNEYFEAKDQRFDYGEDRYIALGNIRNRVFVIAYTYRNDKICIISARKANQRESQQFQERIT